MEIYVLRHAIAQERGSGPDSERALTAAGREKLRRVLARARTAGVSPALILSSPYKRAVHSAEMAAEVLAVARKIVATDALLPGSSSAELWREICAHREEPSLLLAGHEPMLSASIAWMLGVAALQVDLKKAALVRIDNDHFGPRPRGVLKWMLTPRLAGGE